jgi:hypothetical protein
MAEAAIAARATNLVVARFTTVSGGSRLRPAPMSPYRHYKLGLASAA